jgi:two-component system, OmpR family, response regulator
MQHKILVVEDEADVLDLLLINLRAAGFTVVTVEDGAQVLNKVRSEAPSLIILDLMLPKMSGLEICKVLKSDAATRHIPVIMLTAKAEEVDKIVGLELGADDYVTKPFSTEEVAARLRGLVRRAGLTHLATGDALTIGDLSMLEDAREVWRGGDPIELTATEFELLRFLMRNPRRVLSKSQILAQVWDYDFGGTAHVVELYISYLRKKIDAGRPAMIHTVRGVGYVLKPS